MVMRWSGIQSAIDILKTTRLKVENVINEGRRAFTGLKLCFSQDSQNYRRYFYKGYNNLYNNSLQSSNLYKNNLHNNLPDNNSSEKNLSELNLYDKNLSVNNLSDDVLKKNSETPRKKEKKLSKGPRATVSKYWKDALYNHWLIFIQGLFLVCLILLISPWIGSNCNDNYSYGESYFDHRPDMHLKQLRKTIDDRSNSISRKPGGFFSYFSTGNDYNYNKRSGILRRKRAYKRFN